MSIVKLPIEIDPIVKSYQYVAFPMSMIQAHGKENVTPWLCKKCINCCFDLEPRENRFIACLNDSYGLKDNVLKHQHIRLNKSTYELAGIRYIDFIKTVLDDKNYVTGYCNEKYISAKKSYMREDYMHDYMIYGYNDDEKIFYSLGYTSSMQYETYTISYGEFVSSILVNNDVDIEFNMWRFNDAKIYELDLDSIISIEKDLEEYMSSTYSGENWKDDYVFGMTAMKYLRDYFSEAEYIDIRFTRAYMEHKYLMLTRLEQLAKVTKSDFTEWIDAYKLIYDNATLIHNLGIKYDITGNTKSRGKVVSLMDEILTRENMIIPALIERLKKYIADCKNTDED